MNTKHSGEFNVLIIKGTGDDILAVCPEFAIVKHGESFDEVRNDIIEAAKGYLETIGKNDLPHELLNRTEELPERYQLLYEIVTNRIEKKKEQESKFKSLPMKVQQAVNQGNAFVMPVCV